MADDAITPLLDRGSRSPSPHRPPRHQPASDSNQPRPFELSTESTPLLSRRDEELHTYGTELIVPSETSSNPEPEPDSKGRNRRIGPIFCAISILLIAGVILAFSFATPTVVKQYVNEATIFHPTNLSINSATADGIQTRVQGDLVLDAKRVQKNSVRNLGRFATWIAREVKTDQSEVQVYLPEYGDALVGTASLPSIKANIRNGHVNHVDFITDLAAGDVQGVRTAAIDWLEGRLSRLCIDGQATLKLKSGLVNFGTQVLSDTLIFEGWFFGLQSRRLSLTSYCRRRFPCPPRCEHYQGECI